MASRGGEGGGLRSERGGRGSPQRTWVCPSCARVSRASSLPSGGGMRGGKRRVRGGEACVGNTSGDSDDAAAAVVDVVVLVVGLLVRVPTRFLGALADDASGIGVAAGGRWWRRWVGVGPERREDQPEPTSVDARRALQVHPYPERCSALWPARCVSAHCERRPWVRHVHLHRPSVNTRALPPPLQRDTSRRHPGCGGGEGLVECDTHEGEHRTPLGHA